MKKLLSVLMALCLVAVPMLACAESEPIYIAVSVPLTGDVAVSGNWIYHGIMLKVDEVNANGGINGRQIIVDTYDDKNDPNEAANIAEKVCSANKYLCVFGEYTSGCTLASAAVYKKNKLVQFVPCANHEDITTPGDTTWGLNMACVTEYTEFARLACEDLGGKRIALIRLNSDNGLIISDTTYKVVGEHGGEVVADESFISGQVRDFTSILTKVKATNPDVVLATAPYSDTSAIAIQSKQIGFDPQVKWLFGNESSTKDFISAAGEAVNGAYVMSTWSPLIATESNQAVVQAYLAKYDGESPSSYSMQPYEGMCMVVDALEKGVTDTAGLQEYLLAMGSWEGQTMSGTWTEKQRLARTGLCLNLVQDGEFVLAN